MVGRVSIYGAPTHEHRPITINGNMTACADCGVIILVPPEPVYIIGEVKLTEYQPSWGYIEQE